MKVLTRLIQQSATSKKHLWLLNRVMNHSVKFNKPHGFQVTRITSEYVQTFAPYHKKNFNHVRGIHACAIATAGELAAGLLLMYHFSPTDYRVILSNLQIDYHYQAKKNVTATASIKIDEKNKIVDALGKNGKTIQTVMTEVQDDDQNNIATVKSTWQIKPWENVQTRV